MRLNKYLDIDGAVCGHQLWWGKNTVGNHFGCGVLVALDSLIYRGRLGERSMTQEAYMALATDFWSVMHPNTGLSFRKPLEAYHRREGIGIYSVAKFRRGLRRISRQSRLTLSMRHLSNRPRLGEKVPGDRGMAMIQDSLKAGRPVHMLVWQDKVYGYNFHWITIIGMDDEERAEIVTWGRTDFIPDFRLFWLRRGLVDHKVLVDYQLE